MATYKGRKVKLNKPFRTPGESKKSAVYVRNPKTKNVIKVRFGDPKLSIKKISLQEKKFYGKTQMFNSQKQNHCKILELQGLEIT